MKHLELVQANFRCGFFWCELWNRIKVTQTCSFSSGKSLLKYILSYLLTPYETSIYWYNHHIIIVIPFLWYLYWISTSSTITIMNLFQWKAYFVPFIKIFYHYYISFGPGLVTETLIISFLRKSPFYVKLHISILVLCNFASLVRMKEISTCR